MSKPLIWLPKMQEDIYEIIKSVINNTMLKDPLLFLTYPVLELKEYTAAQQRCVLYVENTKIVFTYRYSNFYDCKWFAVELTSHTDLLKLAEEFNRVYISLYDKMLHDDISDIDPCEKDIHQCKALEVLYKLKLIGVKE